MIEVFLTYIDKGASNNSLGILMKTNGSALAMGFDNNDSYQQIFIVIAPYLFLVVLCLLTRWIAQRTLIILDN